MAPGRVRCLNSTDKEEKKEGERRRFKTVWLQLFMFKQLYVILELQITFPLLSYRRITLTSHDSSVDTWIICADRREDRAASLHKWWGIIVARDHTEGNALSWVQTMEG